MMKAMAKIKNGESGMTLFAVMGIMVVFAIGLLAVAPSVLQEVQHEKELEAIARGEEVAEAIRQYVEFYRGAKLPNSMKDLLDGLDSKLLSTNNSWQMRFLQLRIRT